MLEDEFLNLYWKEYILIEKEFKATNMYLTIDLMNFTAYSDAFTKLILEIGSEVDVVAKELCRTINRASTAKKLHQYRPEIIGRFSEFPNVTVACGNIDLKPWKDWEIRVPVWWDVYNGIKHNRNGIELHAGVSLENYKFANLENILNSLAGLYQLEQYLYCIITHDPVIETPLPGSRFFRMKDFGWENKRFGKDNIFYIDQRNGHLYSMETDKFYTDY